MGSTADDTYIFTLFCVKDLCVMLFAFTWNNIYGSVICFLLFTAQYIIIFVIEWCLVHSTITGNSRFFYCTWTQN